MTTEQPGTDRAGPSAVAVRFSTSLRLAVEASGLSLAELRKALLDAGADVTAATLSRWQNGRARPSGTASEQVVLMLERVLGLPAASLVGLLPAPSRRGPRPTMTPSAFPAYTGEWDDWPGPTKDQVDYRVWHETVTLGEDGSLVDIAEQSTVTARVDGVRSLAFAFRDPYGTPAREMVAEATHGCTIGRVRDDEAQDVRHWEVVLDEPLSGGESATYGWRFGPTTPRPLTEHMIILDHPVSVLTVELVHLGRTPLRVSHVSQTRATEPVVVVEAVQPGPNGRALVVLHDPPMGAHGLGWEPV